MSGKTNQHSLYIQFERKILCKHKTHFLISYYYHDRILAFNAIVWILMWLPKEVDIGVRKSSKASHFVCFIMPQVY